jgi:hypothetical protein
METVTKSDIKEILAQLAMLRKDVEYMKSIISDDDCVLSEDDKEAITEYKKEKNEGKLKSLEEIKKSLNYT